MLTLGHDYKCELIYAFYEQNALCFLIWLVLGHFFSHFTHLYILSRKECIYTDVSGAAQLWEQHRTKSTDSLWSNIKHYCLLETSLIANAGLK